MTPTCLGSSLENGWRQRLGSNGPPIGNCLRNSSTEEAGVSYDRHPTSLEDMAGNIDKMCDEISRKEKTALMSHLDAGQILFHYKNLFQTLKMKKAGKN